MRALSAADFLEIWEDGAQRGFAERATLLLRRAFPRLPDAELAGLSVGQSNALLLRLRARTFGPQLECYLECPSCSERLELPISIPGLLTDAPEPLAPRPQAELLVEGGYQLRVRLPELRDVVAATAGRSREAALPELLRRCVSLTEPEGGALDPAVLSESVLAQIDTWMTTADPLAVLTLLVDCPACKHRWDAALDIAEYFFSEVVAQAKRLMREVHALAKEYGWSEAQILAMSAVRRKAYLELGG